jgi:hypothetical protein
MKFIAAIAASAAILTAAPAFAGDAPAKPAPTTNSFSFEVGTEYKVSNDKYADLYTKGSISHTYSSGIIWGGSFQQVWKADQNQQELLETTLGYNFKLNPVLTATSSGGVGYQWSSVDQAPAKDFGYYVFNAGLNAKVSPKVTWTVVSGRWRDAFVGGWQTPKLSTSISYTWAPASQVFFSYGYGWKNGVADKYSYALGLKLAF